MKLISSFNKSSQVVSPVNIMVVIAAVVLTACYAGLLHAGDPDFEALAQKKKGARELIERPTLYREAEIKGLPCSMEDFDFLLDRPSTSVALAGKMHKSLDRYAIDRIGPGVFHIDDQKELAGDMEVISVRPGKRIYYISGYWRLVLKVRLKGKMALVLDYDEDAGGRTINAKARGYMLVDNSVAGAAFKLAAYLFPKKVDKRIDRFATAVKKVVYAIHEDPEAALGRLEKSRHVPEQEVREFRSRFLGRQGAKPPSPPPPGPAVLSSS